jgi:hypothetical protein
MINPIEILESILDEHCEGSAIAEEYDGPIDDWQRIEHSGYLTDDKGLIVSLTDGRKIMVIVKEL